MSMREIGDTYGRASEAYKGEFLRRNPPVQPRARRSPKPKPTPPHRRAATKPRSSRDALPYAQTAAPVQAASTPLSGPAAFSEQLTEYFTEHDRAMLPRVAVLVKKSAGRRNVLIKKLEAKYDGAPFPISRLYTKALRAFFTRVDPSKVDAAASYLKKFKGREVTLVAKLEAKYGAPFEV